MKAELLRDWLIAALTHAKLPELDAEHWPELLETAESEGVLVLLEYLLQRHPGIAMLPCALRSQIQQSAKQSLLRQLPFFAEQKAIFQALNEAGIPYIVMKGAALGCWLHASPNHRPVTDIDVWITDRQAVPVLTNVIRPLGFECIETSGDLTSYEQAFDKNSNGNKIRLDAHWAMFNSAVLAPAVKFDEAYSRSKTIDAHGNQVKALSICEALINSIGHRAMKCLSRQENTLKWLYDQHLLFSALNEAEWMAFVGECASAGISDLALDSIEQSVQTFNTNILFGVTKALSENAKHEKINRRWFQSWARYQWHEMQAVSPNLRVRLQWLGQKLWPNPEAMREGYGRNDSAWKFMLRRIGIGLRRLLGDG